MTGLSNKSAPNKNDSSKLAFNRNNNNRPAFRKNDGNSEVNKFSFSRNCVDHNKMLKNLSKSKKSKSKKTSKSWNLAKSEKKLLKSENLTNFGAIKARLKILTPDTKTTFNYLWLVFTITLIFQHFYLKCHT